MIYHLTLWPLLPCSLYSRSSRPLIQFEDRYPQHDHNLFVQRKYDGKGASKTIRWLIDIPNNYQYTIVLKYGQEIKEHKILFAPGEKKT